MDWKARLTEARERRQLSKSAFAKLVGVSAATATDWEKDKADGGIAEINGTNLTRVCEVLGVSAAWLLTGRDRPKDDLSPAVELLNIYAALPPAARGTVLAFARITADEHGINRQSAANDQF